MECLPKDSILEFNPTVMEDVRKTCNLENPKEMAAAITILEEWVKQQAHFIKKDFNRHYLELSIIVSKGSLEKAKLRLDKICTLRTLMPEFFGAYDIRKDFVVDLKDMIQVVLPKMMKDHGRVYVFKTFGQKYEPNCITNVIRASFIFADYIRSHDYTDSFYGLYDFRDANLMELLPKMQISELRQLSTIIMDGYGFRVKGIHILSSSKMIDVTVSIFKQVLKGKIAERVYVHKDNDSVLEVFGKEILPVNFGGEEKSLEELQEDWFKVLSEEEFVKYRKDMNEARTDESLRQRDTFNEQYIGMPGTFRTLSVD